MKTAFFCLSRYETRKRLVYIFFIVQMPHCIKLSRSGRKTICLSCLFRLFRLFPSVSAIFVVLRINYSCEDPTCNFVIDMTCASVGDIVCESRGEVRTTEDGLGVRMPARTWKRRAWLISTRTVQTLNGNANTCKCDGCDGWDGWDGCLGRAPAHSFLKHAQTHEAIEAIEAIRDERWGFDAVGRAQKTRTLARVDSFQANCFGFYWYGKEFN